MNTQEVKGVLLEAYKAIANDTKRRRPSTIGQCSIDTGYDLLEVEKHTESLESDGKVELSAKKPGKENISIRKVSVVPSV